MGGTLHDSPPWASRLSTLFADPVLLAFAAAASHAIWNFLLKRAGGGEAVVGLSKVAEAILFAPLFVIAVLHTPAAQLRMLAPLAAVGAALTGANYFFLARAYQVGQFSLVYPVSRGAVLLALPPLGWLVFRESIDLVTASAIALILIGIVTVQLHALTFAELRRFRHDLVSHPGTGSALLAAVAAAGYTIWDKHAVQDLEPFTYFYAYTLLIAIGFALKLSTPSVQSGTRTACRTHWRTIVFVGVLNTITYVLILFALRTGHSTQVTAIRQLSIALGAGLGWWLLREAATLPRRTGVALILVGALVVAIL
jgi:drug/metabolite transporter (DMT)-like permease